MAKFVCGVTGETVESDSLPDGWLIPPDVALDEEREVPPHGTVIAVSSKKALDKLLSARLGRR